MIRKIPKIKLNDDHQIPIITQGISPKQALPTDKLKTGLTEAIKQGHRSIEIAEAYGRDEEIGEILKNSGVKKNEFYMTTKFANTMKDEKKMDEYLHKSLKLLDIENFDMLMLHVSFSPKIDVKAWKVLEKYKEKGLTKSIGLCSYETYDLEVIIENGKVKPAILEVDASLGYFNHNLFLKCIQNNIVFSSFNPIYENLMNGTLNKGPLFEAFETVSKTYNLTKIQVMLAFFFGCGVIPVVRFFNAKQIEESLATLNRSEIFHSVYGALSKHTLRQRYMPCSDCWLEEE